MALIRFRIAPGIGAFLVMLALLPAVALTHEQRAVSAQSAERIPTFTTHLVPGVNLVGWLEAEAPTQDLFDAVPEIRVAYAWDATTQEWLAASPDSPTALRSLRVIRPGMGLYVVIGGDDSVNWVRPQVPALGVLNLSKGLNLVAWSGVSELSISHLVRRVDASFARAHVWDPLVGSYTSHVLRQGDTNSSPIGVHRGGAIWITVDNDAAWFQSSSAPPLEGWEIRGRVIGFNGTPLSGRKISASGPNPPESYAETGQDGSFSVAAPWNGAYRLTVWLGEDCIVFHQVGGATPDVDWPERSHIWVSNADVANVLMVVPERGCGWRIPGRVVDSAGVGLEGVRLSAFNDATTTVNYTTQADGSFDIRVLTDGFYKLWISPIADEFCSIYYSDDGVTLFRDEGSWIQVTDADADDLIIRLPQEICAGRVRGRVLDAHGMPVAGSHVHTLGPRDVLSETRTEEDGSFSVAVPVFGTYRIQVWTERESACAIPAGTVDVGPSEGVEAQQGAAGVATGATVDVEIIVPPDRCVRQIRGRLLSAGGRGVADAWIWASEAQGERGGALTEVGGSFAITVPLSGTYTLGFWATHDCYAYYNESADASPNHASHVTVGDADVTGITIRIPDNPCG